MEGLTLVCVGFVAAAGETCVVCGTGAVAEGTVEGAFVDSTEFLAIDIATGTASVVAIVPRCVECVAGKWRSRSLVLCNEKFLVSGNLALLRWMCVIMQRASDYG
jgi:hypothetical protein